MPSTSISVSGLLATRVLSAERPNWLEIICTGVHAAIVRVRKISSSFKVVSPHTHITRLCRHSAGRMLRWWCVIAGNCQLRNASGLIYRHRWMKLDPENQPDCQHSHIGGGLGSAIPSHDQSWNLLIFFCRWTPCWVNVPLHWLFCSTLDEFPKVLGIRAKLRHCYHARQAVHSEWQLKFKHPGWH